MQKGQTDSGRANSGALLARCQAAEAKEAGSWFYCSNYLNVESK